MTSGDKTKFFSCSPQLFTLHLTRSVYHFIGNFSLSPSSCGGQMKGWCVHRESHFDWNGWFTTNKTAHENTTLRRHDASGAALITGHGSLERTAGPQSSLLLDFFHLIPSTKLLPVLSIRKQYWWNCEEITFSILHFPMKSPNAMILGSCQDIVIWLLGCCECFLRIAKQFCRLSLTGQVSDILVFRYGS